MTDVPDRIEKQVILRASRARVWRAVSDAKEFGAWFGVVFDAPFVAGKALAGKITPTKADPEVAKTQKPHEGKSFDFTVAEIDPERRISFRWHPYAVDSSIDYSSEPTTLIVFELSDVEGGTLLKITESGFSKIPLARRAEAFKMNDGGWAAQTSLITKYLANAS